MTQYHSFSRALVDFIFANDAHRSTGDLSPRPNRTKWRSGKALPGIAALFLTLSNGLLARGQEAAPPDDRQEIRVLRERIAGLESQVNELKALMARFVQMPEANRVALIGNAANHRALCASTASPNIPPTKSANPEETRIQASPTAVAKTEPPQQIAGLSIPRVPNKEVTPGGLVPDGNSPQVAMARGSQAEQTVGDHPERSPEHTMQIPGGGPELKIRGFLDFNFGLGSVANPLIYPLTIPPQPVHNSFQFGEFDLFMTSQLSDTVGFLSEVVFGSDASNFWGIDIERAQLTYKPNDYFQISGGRFHTAIGYYNTAFHHGTWFQTATGRPFMDFFEDSGGILPVHSVGITATGLMPGTGKLNLHWIAEVGNGVSSLYIGQPIVNQPVQNFLADRNRKAFNFAGYVKPDWVNGLQVGGSYYNDEIAPAGTSNVEQNIESAYAVYVTPDWEFLNEFVVERNRYEGQTRTFDTPLGYTQLSRRFGKYRPYVRFQYVKVPGGDPLYATVGKYVGPSVGLRMDFTNYVALKVQYNRVNTLDPRPKNGLDSQVSFTF